MEQGQTFLLVDPQARERLDILAPHPRDWGRVQADAAHGIKQIIIAQGGALWISNTRNPNAPVPSCVVKRHLTSEIMSINLSNPVILSFLLLHGAPAIAGQTLGGFDRVIATTYTGAVIEFAKDGTDITARLKNNETVASLHGDPVLIDAPAPTEDAWRTRNCMFKLNADTQTAHGDIPELDEAFQSRFETFERRLCLRDLVQIETDYLHAPYTLAQEDAILQLARDCGYWQTSLFAKFANAVLVLGEEGVRTGSIFECAPDLPAARGLLPMAEAGDNMAFHKDMVDRFGADYRARALD